jgi:flavin-binding protein dodecin
MTPGEVAELQGRSSTSIEDAIKRGIGGMNRTIQNVRCLWMKDQRVVGAGAGREYHVDMLVTFIGEDWQRSL